MSQSIKIDKTTVCTYKKFNYINYWLKTCSLENISPFIYCAPCSFLLETSQHLKPYVTHHSSKLSVEIYRVHVFNISAFINVSMKKINIIKATAIIIILIIIRCKKMSVFICNWMQQCISFQLLLKYVAVATHWILYPVAKCRYSMHIC